MNEQAGSYGMCPKCGQRPGLVRWVGDGGTLALAHGMGEFWCKVCVLDAQIEFAEARAAALPGLKAERAALSGEGTPA